MERTAVSCARCQIELPEAPHRYRFAEHSRRYLVKTRCREIPKAAVASLCGSCFSRFSALRKYRKLSNKIGPLESDAEIDQAIKKELDGIDLENVADPSTE